MLGLATALISAVPTIAGWFGGDDAEDTAKKVVNIAKSVTGIDDSQGAVDIVLKDPEQARKFQEAILNWRIGYEQEKTKRLESVNRTMQAEAGSKHWPQWLWRPWCGFWFPPTVIGVYIFLPLLGKAIPDIPANLWLAWLAILGVAVWDRGKEKRAQTGEQRKSLLASAIEAIRK